MSHDSPAESARALATAAVDAAWRQWKRVGAAATGPAPASPAIVDPEALFLASVRLARYEARLAELAEEWAIVNGDLMSLGRLRALAAELPDASRQAFGVICRRIRERSGDARWQSLVQRNPTSLRAVAERAPARKAARPDFDRQAATMLRLRLIFGVGTRPDVLAVLAGRADEWMDVRTISRLTAYTAAAVRATLSDFTDARWVERATGPTTRYRATREAMIARISPYGVRAEPLPMSQWLDFRDAYPFVTDLLDEFDSGTMSGASSYVQATRCRELMRARWQFWIELGVTREPKAPFDSPWLECARSLKTLEDWFGRA